MLALIRSARREWESAQVEGTVKNVIPSCALWARVRRARPHAAQDKQTFQDLIFNIFHAIQTSRAVRSTQTRSKQPFIPKSYAYPTNEDGGKRPSSSKWLPPQP